MIQLETGRQRGNNRQRATRGEHARGIPWLQRGRSGPPSVTCRSAAGMLGTFHADLRCYADCDGRPFVEHTAAAERDCKVAKRKPHRASQWRVDHASDPLDCLVRALPYVARTPPTVTPSPVTSHAPLLVRIRLRRSSAARMPPAEETTVGGGSGWRRVERRQVIRFCVSAKLHQAHVRKGRQLLVSSTVIASGMSKTLASAGRALVYPISF